MPDRLPQINLLPEYRRDSQIQSLLYYTFVALILLSFIVLGYFYFSTKGKLEAATKEAIELSEERDSLAKQKEALEADDGSLYEQAVHFAENYAVPTSKLILELNRLLPENGHLSEYAYTSSEVNIQAHVETLDKVAEYTNRLTNSEYISDLRVESIKTFTLKEEASAELQQFDVIPRYESDFSLTVDKLMLKEEESDEDE